MSKTNYNPRVAVAIGGLIYCARADAGLTISELRDSLPPGSPSASTLGRYEHGIHCPSIEALLQLALGLGVEPGALLPTLAEIPALLGVKRAE